MIKLGIRMDRLHKLRLSLALTAERQVIRFLPLA